MVTLYDYPVLYVLSVCLVAAGGGQPTGEPSEGDSCSTHGQWGLSCCAQLYHLSKDVREIKNLFQKEVAIGTATKPGRSCRHLRQDGVTTSGVYWINPDPDVYRFPFQVWCEMEFLGGGWLRVYNMMAKPQTTQAASEMFTSISRNADARVVLSNSTSTAIYTKGLRLQEHTEVVFGWSESSDALVSNYGIMTSPKGLQGVCYIDGVCGDGADIGNIRSSVTGNERLYQTGLGNGISHVGIGYQRQAIVWGYDSNDVHPYSTAGTFYSHWGNWNDTMPVTTQTCCNSGATQELPGAGLEWRYSILIR